MTDDPDLQRFTASDQRTRGGEVVRGQQQRTDQRRVPVGPVYPVAGHRLSDRRVAGREDRRVVDQAGEQRGYQR